jgi:hypothetical protein
MGNIASRTRCVAHSLRGNGLDPMVRDHADRAPILIEGEDLLVALKQVVVDGLLHGHVGRHGEALGRLIAVTIMNRGLARVESARVPGAGRPAPCKHGTLNVRASAGDGSPADVDSDNRFATAT